MALSSSVPVQRGVQPPRLCPICQYDLTGLAPVGSPVLCPECGNTVSPHEIDTPRPQPDWWSLFFLLAIPVLGAAMLGSLAIVLSHTPGAANMAMGVFALGFVTSTLLLVRALGRHIALPDRGTTGLKMLGLWILVNAIGLGATTLFVLVVLGL